MISQDDKEPNRANDSKSSEMPHEILIAEFEYLATAAQQANEDRAKVIQYYFISLGSLGASLVGLKDIPAIYLQWAYGSLTLIFLILTVFGVFTVRQLISLRIAWLDSSLAMDKIKDYYKGSFSEESWSAVIRFRTEKLPNAYKRGSISHLLALAASLMGSLSLLIASIFLDLALFNCLAFNGVIIGGILLTLGLFFWLKAFYRRELENSGIQCEIDKIKNKQRK